MNTIQQLLIKCYISITLILAQPLPHADGEIEGFTVRIDGRSHGSYAMNNYSRCQFKIENMPKEFDLHISNFNVIDRFFSALGSKPLKTGNEEFDKRFSMSCNDEPIFRAC